MIITYDYTIFNSTSSRVGPLNIAEIFSCNGDGYSEVFVEANSTFSFKAGLVDPFEHIQRRFAKRLEELGVDPAFFQFLRHKKKSEPIDEEVAKNRMKERNKHFLQSSQPHPGATDVGPPPEEV